MRLAGGERRRVARTRMAVPQSKVERRRGL